MKTKSVLGALGLSLSLFTALPLAMADGVQGSGEAIDTVAPARNQAVVQVRGIVCSFCAYGTEKALSKLSFLDQSQFGDDGVLMNIHTHRLTLALRPDRKMDLPQIYNAIKRGGYDPVTFYVNLYGQIRQSGERYLLTTPGNGQIFELSGSDIGALIGRGVIEIIGLVDVARIAELKAGKPIPVVLISAEIKSISPR